VKRVRVNCVLSAAVGALTTARAAECRIRRSPQNVEERTRLYYNKLRQWTTITLVNFFYNVNEIAEPRTETFNMSMRASVVLQDWK